MSHREEQVERVWQVLIAIMSAGESVTRRLVDALAQPIEVTDETREAVKSIVSRAEVRLIHGGCNVPDYHPGVTVYFPGDDWRDLTLAVGTREPDPYDDRLARLKERCERAEAALALLKTACKGCQ